MRQNIYESDNGTPILQDILFGDGNPSSRTQNHDIASDRYTLTLPGLSTVFRRNWRTGAFVPVNFSRMLIEGNEGEGTAGESWFRVVNTDGFEYTFRQTEHTGAKSEEGTTGITAWYLTEVNTPWGRITLSYTPSEEYTMSSFSEELRTGDFGLLNGKDEDGITFRIETRHTTHGTRLLFKTPVLSTIEWNGHRVAFSYQHDRKDLWKTRLTRIDVINCDGDTVRTATLGNGRCWGSSERNYRMMLDSVTVSGEGRYAFRYMENGSGMPDYPYCSEGQDRGDRVTCVTDYWGYWNGRRSPHAYPKECRDYILGLNGTTEFRSTNPTAFPESDFADRTPDVRYAAIGTLDRISYPTGGWTDFSFEGNALGRGGLRIAAISSYDHDGRLATRKTYDYRQPTAIGDHPKESMSYISYFHTDGRGYMLSYQTRSTCRTVTDQPQWPLCTGAPIVYQEVEELRADSSSTVCTFTAFPTPESTQGQFNNHQTPLLTYNYKNDFGHVTPYMTHRVWKDTDGSMLRTEDYDYDIHRMPAFSAGCQIVNLYRLARLCTKSLEASLWPHELVNDATFPADSITVHPTSAAL